MENEIKKYPRTRHVRGSRFQHGDYDLEAAPWSELQDQSLVVEEKIDGANAGISFTADGELRLQSRGHYLTGGPREKHFNLLKQWAATHMEALYCVLGDRFVMYGEWMFAKHTCFYDALPHYFMEFDILDTQDGSFLGEAQRGWLLFGGSVRAPVTQVRVLHRGYVESVEHLASMIGPSAFITPAREATLRRVAAEHGVDPDRAVQQTDMSPLMEGLYVKAEHGGQVVGRYKYVRSSFTNAILDSEEHWLARPIVPNQLAPGAFEAMFV